MFYYIDSKSVDALDSTFNKEQTLLDVFSGNVYLVSISKLRNSNLQLSTFQAPSLFILDMGKLKNVKM